MKLRKLGVGILAFSVISLFGINTHLFMSCENNVGNEIMFIKKNKHNYKENKYKNVYKSRKSGVLFIIPEKNNKKLYTL